MPVFEVTDPFVLGTVVAGNARMADFLKMVEQLFPQPEVQYYAAMVLMRKLEVDCGRATGLSLQPLREALDEILEEAEAMAKEPH